MLTPDSYIDQHLTRFLDDFAEIIGIPTPGQLALTPEQTTTYTLVAFCSNNMVLAEQVVTVE